MTEDFWGEPISRYTRQQALDDGVLVDVSVTAREAGFTIPVAVTHRVWTELIVPDAASREVGQSEAGRIWDVLFLLHVAIRQAPDRSELQYQVIFLFEGKIHREVTLRSVCGPDDELSPCITIMRDDED